GAAPSDELAETCVISVSASLSYCQNERSSIRGFVLWRRSDRSRDHHSSRYSRAGSTQMTEHSRKVLLGFEAKLLRQSRTPGGITEPENRFGELWGQGGSNLYYGSAVTAHTCANRLVVAAVKDGGVERLHKTKSLYCLAESD